MFYHIFFNLHLFFPPESFENWLQHDILHQFPKTQDIPSPYHITTSNKINNSVISKLFPKYLLSSSLNKKQKPKSNKQTNKKSGSYQSSRKHIYFLSVLI